MNLSCSRMIRFGSALIGVFTFAALAAAAPPPGMRWGDHSGLGRGARTAPSATYSRPAVVPASGVVTSAPFAGTTVYYPPLAVNGTTYYYTPSPAPGVTWYYYPNRPTVIYSPPIVTPSIPSVVVSPSQ